MNEEKSSGQYTAQWNAAGCASGIYYCKFAARNLAGAQDFHMVRKIFITKIIRELMKKLIILNVVILFNSIILAASLKDYQFISPTPGSDFNTRESSIIIREGSFMDPTCVNNSEAIQVTGSKSGKISGVIVLSSDKQTVIFKPAYKFEPDETVSCTDFQ